jgi:hypothetical protein
MNRSFLGRTLAIALVASIGWLGSAGGQDKKRTGSVTGEIKSKKDTPNGKNVILEVLAAGEEKARSYRVQYDPAVKGPLVDVLKAVRDAKVGDKTEFDWMDTGEGLAITKFQVLKKEKDKE